MERFNKKTLNLKLFTFDKKQQLRVTSWNKNSFCIYFIHTHSQNSNIYKNLNILLNVFNQQSQNYSVMVPIKIYTEVTNTYMNIEGIKKKTKTSVTTKGSVVDLKSFLVGIRTHNYINLNVVHKSNIFFKTCVYTYLNYILPNISANNKIHIQNIGNNVGLQYAAFIKKNINHETKYILHSFLESQYLCTSYNTNIYTANSPSLLYMHKKFVTEQYYTLYYS